MANPTAAPLDPTGTGGANRRGPFMSELWELTGVSSGVGTTVAITPRHFKRPVAAIGPVTYTISGQTITLTLLDDITTLKVLVEILGRV